MANNKIQIKRTTVSGRTANTTDAANTAFIDKGELAVNLADRKIFSSDSSNAIFEVGSNLASLQVTTIAAGNTTITGDLTVNNYVIAANGATSAYATKYLVEYNPTTKDLTYSSKPDASRPYITGYGQEIHVSPVALDDTGNGTIGDPVKTIAQALVLAAAAFETTSAGERKTIILHPGDYAANVTIDTQYLVLSTHELIGKNTTLSGTLTINKGCTVEGLKMTNLIIAANSSVGTVDLIGCTVATATTKTAGAYTVFRACDLSSSTLNITGGGSVVMVGGNYGNVTVANTSAGVLAKAVVTMGPTTLTSGTMQISDTLVYAASNTASAITQSAGSILTLNNSQTLIPDLSNVARNTFGGFYSILHSVYDKTNSTFGGTSLAAVDYGQHLNIDKLIVGNTTVNVAITSTAITSNATLAVGNTTVTGFANVTSTIQGGSSLTIAGAASGITTLAAGNTTITGFANVTTSIQGGSTLTIAGAASGITTLATGNTTVTGFVNATSSVNAASHTVGTSFIANATGITTTGFANVGTTLAAGNTTVTGTISLSNRINQTGTVTDAGGYIFLGGQINSTQTGQQNMFTMQSQISPQGAGTLAGLYGLLFLPTIVSSANNITSILGVFGRVDSAASYTGTVDAIYTFSAATPIWGSGTLPTNVFQYTAFNATATTNVRGFWGQITAGANKWNLYASGTANNYMAGGLGIGTTTLTAPLTVAGAAAIGNTTITGFANVTSTIQGGSSLTIAGAASGITTLAAGNTTITGFANVSSTLQVTGDATFAANANFDSGALFVDGTNNRVGIGTTAPAVNFEVSSATGSATPTPTEMRISTTTVASDFSQVSPWGRLSFYSADISDAGPKIQGSIDAISDAAAGGRMSMVFKTAAVTTGTLTERMRINSNGNIGIGNTAPASKLVVAGTVELGNTTITGFANVTSTLAAGNTTITGFANVTTSIQGGSSLTIAGAASGITTLAAGNTTITGFANVTTSIQGGSSLTIAGALSGVTTAAMGNTTITGFANVTTTLQVGTNTATFGTAAYIVANGNVGIGTASPASQLHISTAGEQRLIIESDSTNAVGEDASFIEVRTDGGAVKHLIGTPQGTTNDLSLRAGGGLTDVSSVASAMTFFTKPTLENPVERMRIGNTGNVGIGNTTPAHKLSVDGTAALGNTTITGFANVSSTLAVAGITTFSGNVVLGSVGLSANGGFGTAGQVLSSNGTAAYWTTAAGGTPGGANTQVQFNDSGAFGGSAGFTFDKTTNNVTIANSLIMNTQSITLTSGANTLTINPFNMFTGAGNSFSIAANNNNFTSIFIAANGNVGIQNNTPGAILSIGSNTMVLGASSKASPGYTWLPNGILMQWGTVSSNTTTGDVSFPVSFPTAIIGVTVTPQVTYIVNGYPNVIAQTTAGCNVRTGSTTSRNMFWQAIGY